MDIIEFYNKVENIVKKDKNSLKSGYYIVSNKMIGSVNMSFKERIDWVDGRTKNKSNQGAF